MTSRRQNCHPDVMHKSRLTPPCKTTFPSPGRAHRNSRRVCKKNGSFLTWSLSTPQLSVARGLMTCPAKLDFSLPFLLGWRTAAKVQGIILVVTLPREFEVPGKVGAIEWQNVPHHKVPAIPALTTPTGKTCPHSLCEAYARALHGKN